MLRDALKSSSLYSIATFARRLSSLVMVPIYTRYLTLDDYGVMSMLDITINLFSLVVSVKVGNALFYHCARTQDEEQQRDYIGNALLLATLMGFAGAAMGWLTAPWVGPWFIGVPRSAYYLSLSFVSLALGFTIDVGFSVMRLRNQPGHFAAASVGRLLTAIFFNVVTIVFMGMGLEGMLISTVISSILTAVYVVWSSLHGGWFRPSIAICREMASYSLPLLLSGACTFVINSADRLILRWYVPMSEIGLYTLAYKLGMMVTYVYAPVELYWGAQMHKVLREPGGERDYVRFTTYVMLLMTGVTLGLAVYTQPVVKLAAGREFQECAKYVPLIAFACLLRAGAQIGRSTLFVEGKTFLEARSAALSAAICLVAYLSLIPFFGAWGAVAATVAGFGALLVIGQHYAQQTRRIHFEYDRLSLILGSALLVAVIGSFVPPAENIWKMILQDTGVFLLYPILLAALGFLSMEERTYLKGLWGRLRAPAGIA